MDAISSDVRRVRAEISRGLAEKVGRTEVDEIKVGVAEGITQARLELREWVDDACQSHQAIVDGLCQNLDQARMAAHDQGLVLRKHEGWMELVFAWMEKVRVREQGLTLIMCHLVEKTSPEVMKLLEK